MNLKNIASVLVTVACFAGGSFLAQMSFSAPASARVAPEAASVVATPAPVVASPAVIEIPEFTVTASVPSKRSVKAPVAKEGKMYCAAPVESNLGTMVQYCEVF
jgi:hypothetical protein